MKLDREFLEWLIFGGAGGRRFTQSSPVLPDVWIAYGSAPGERHQLLLTPHRKASAGAAARVLRERLGLAADGSGEAPAERGHFLVYTPTSVAVRVSLQELVRDVLPMTSWWKERFFPGRGAGGETARELDEEDLVEAIENLEQGLVERNRRSDERARRRTGDPRKQESPTKGNEGARAEPLSVDVVWMTWIVGWLAWAAEADPAQCPSDASPPPEPEALGEWLDEWRHREDPNRRGPAPRDLVRVVARLFGREEASDAPFRLPEPPDENDSRLWQINRNREAHLAVRDSRLAIKADAAIGLFDVRCDKIAWAVIDSGIDARHPAFRTVDREGKRYAEPFVDGKLRTRVEATYDFTRTRLLLNPALLTHLEAKIQTSEERSGFTMLPAKLEKALDRLDTDPLHRDSLRGQIADLRGMLARHDAAWEGEGTPPLRTQLADLKKRLASGANVDWGLLEPFLGVAHDDSYWAPASDHGTHVAGILGADWRRDDGSIELQGICPDIRLYDLRVLPTGLPGPEDELNVIAALQFVRHLNSASSDVVIHGVNLSLSIPHPVASFACGRTPVCDECDRVAVGGVVVVAAAGNSGWQRFNTSQGLLDGYHSISITDPGNAESVITVGATHRNKPHTYGVSYFSSRGPTGDGRIKPDLVAPGEKITAPVLGGFEGEKDGTSMAAPHVSGAAAILMARHRELIGQAERIKKILCDTATDLGRERYFQGHGMLDVLRALQSV